MAYTYTSIDEALTPDSRELWASEAEDARNGLPHVVPDTDNPWYGAFKSESIRPF